MTAADLTDAELGALWLERAGWWPDPDDTSLWVVRRGAEVISVQEAALAADLPTALRIVVPEMAAAGWEPTVIGAGWAWSNEDKPITTAPRYLNWSKPETVARAMVESSGRARGWW